mmetsp:Transcript_3067/g.5684  ORF Transcript_3067/g.5684 Transcript_3067/m.5684 type:complete len:299 (+) Transcript_3067:858-1754(+)
MDDSYDHAKRYADTTEIIENYNQTELAAAIQHLREHAPDLGAPSVTSSYSEESRAGRARSASTRRQARSRSSSRRRRRSGSPSPRRPSSGYYHHRESHGYGYYGGSYAPKRHRSRYAASAAVRRGEERSRDLSPPAGGPPPPGQDRKRHSCSHSGGGARQRRTSSVYSSSSVGKNRSSIHINSLRGGYDCHHDRHDREQSHWERKSNTSGRDEWRSNSRSSRASRASRASTETRGSSIRSPPLPCAYTSKQHQREKSAINGRCSSGAGSADMYSYPPAESEVKSGACGGGMRRCRLQS